MSSKPSVRFDYAILCDEIRKEENKKLMLLGVYSGSVLVREFPTKLGLSSYIHGVANKTGKVAIEIRYKIDNDDTHPQIVSATGILAVQDISASKEVGISVVRIPIEINAPAKLSLACKAEGGRWKTLLTKEVTLFPTSTNAREQP